MARDEQIRIDITATDEASDVADHVADRLDQLEGRDTDVQVTADTDQAEAGIESVEGKVDQLAGADAAIEVTADTGAAERAIDGTADQLRQLSQRDTEIVLEAKVRDLKGQLKSAESALDSYRGAADRAEDSTREVGETSRVGGNAIADLAGPLGDAEGAASTAGGVFDGLSDIVEGLGGAFGLSAQGAENIAMGLGLAGIAVAGIAAAYTKITGDQKKAQEQAKATADAQREINDAIAEGSRLEAARQFLDTYEGIEDAARKAGISVKEATRFITGQTDSMGPMIDAAKRAGTANNDLGLSGKALADLTGPLQGLRDQYVAAGEDAAGMETAEQQVAAALAGTTDATELSTEALRELVDQRQAAADSHWAYIDAEEGMRAATERTREAEEALTTAVRDNGPASDQAKAASEALDGARRGERAAAIDAANAAARYAEDQATAAGKTYTAEQRTRNLNLSLIDSARKATPQARDQIIAYIAEVNDIPLSKASEIVASTSGTEEARRQIDDAARDRQMTIFVDAAIKKSWLNIPLGSFVSGAPAAGPAVAGMATPMAAPVAAPPITVHVDARGAPDPYSVGRRVEQALASWRGVSGQWRPGVPA